MVVGTVPASYLLLLLEEEKVRRLLCACVSLHAAAYDARGGDHACMERTSLLHAAVSYL